jgi:hypothetical protein
VTRQLRDFFVLTAVIACFSMVASADLKIKTRNTVKGHSTESTVYIKGPRERTEMSFGGDGGAVTIMQCDQKRMITISGNQCSVISTAGGEASCPTMPATPNTRDMGRKMSGGEPEPPRKGGVVTITRNSTDTGERQDMFGYKARHIKTAMVMESTPDACNQSHMKMETDGWYADLSAGFSCADESYRAMACGGVGGGSGCNDRIVMKGGGGIAMGFPLKQTTTIMSPQGNFTITSEVVELASTTLDAPLFDAPAGCKVSDMSAAMMSGAPATTPSESSHAPAANAPAPKAPAAPAPTPVAAVAPKSAGVVRIGVVKVKDMSGEGLPTDNLRLDLMDEITHRQMEAIPLATEAPHQDVESEASFKQCDYILYTTASQVKAPGSGLSPASLPKGVTLDAAKFQALTDVTLYKVGKPQPEMKDLPVVADADQFGVNAVMATFTQESANVAQQVDEDAHPKAASKTTKAPVKKSITATPKPK